MRRRQRTAAVAALWLVACSTPTKPEIPATDHGTRVPSSSEARNEPRNEPHIEPPAVAELPLEAEAKLASTVAADGWTVFTPQPDARRIHVSRDGQDAWPGTLEQPKASIEAAYELLRDGQADWLLLRRGDSWHRTDLLTWSKSGPEQSGAGMMRLGAYGDESLPRPVIDSGLGNALVITPGWRSDRKIRNLAITDIHLIASGRVAAPERAPSDATGVQLVAVEFKGIGLPFSDLLFENVKFHGYSYGLVTGSDIGHLSLRRNIFYRIFSPGGAGQHSSAAMLTPQQSLLLEENVFYLCQYPDMPGVDGFAMFSNSVYIGSDAKNVVARGNFIIKAFDGMMQRSGGVYEHNVSAYTALAYHSGQANGVVPAVNGVRAVVRGNLMLNNDAGPNLGNTRAGEVSDNLVLVDRDGGNKSQDFKLIGRNEQRNGGQLLGTNVGVHHVAFARNHLSGDFVYEADADDSSHYSGLTFADNATKTGVVATSIAQFLAQGFGGSTIDDLGERLAKRDRASFAQAPSTLALINYFRRTLGLQPLQ